MRIVRCRGEAFAESLVFVAVFCVVFCITAFVSRKIFLLGWPMALGAPAVLSALIAGLFFFFSRKTDVWPTDPKVTAAASVIAAQMKAMEESGAFYISDSFPRKGESLLHFRLEPEGDVVKLFLFPASKRYSSFAFMKEVLGELRRNHGLPNWKLVSENQAVPKVHS